MSKSGDESPAVPGRRAASPSREPRRRSARATLVVAPNGAWAMTLQALDERRRRPRWCIWRARSIRTTGWTMSIYAQVVEGLDGKAAKDEALSTLLTDGVADS